MWRMNSLGNKDTTGGLIVVAAFIKTTSWTWRTANRKACFVHWKLNIWHIGFWVKIYLRLTRATAICGFSYLHSFSAIFHSSELSHRKMLTDPQRDILAVMSRHAWRQWIPEPRWIQTLSTPLRRNVFVINTKRFYFTLIELSCTAHPLLDSEQLIKYQRIISKRLRIFHFSDCDSASRKPLCKLCAILGFLLWRVLRTVVKYHWTKLFGESLLNSRAAGLMKGSS